MALRSTNWMTRLKLVHLKWPELLHHQLTRLWDSLEPMSILQSQFDEINQHGPSSRKRRTGGRMWRWVNRGALPSELPSRLKTCSVSEEMRVIDWQLQQTSPSVTADISEPRLVSPPSSFFSPSVALLLNKCQYKTSRQMRPETPSPSP